MYKISDNYSCFIIVEKTIRENQDVYFISIWLSLHLNVFGDK